MWVKDPTSELLSTQVLCQQWYGREHDDYSQSLGYQWLRDNSKADEFSGDRKPTWKKYSCAQHVAICYIQICCGFYYWVLCHCYKMIGVNLLGKIETMSAFEFIAQKLFELHHKFQSEGLFCKLKRTDKQIYEPRKTLLLSMILVG